MMRIRPATIAVLLGAIGCGSRGAAPSDFPPGAPMAWIAGCKGPGCGTPGDLIVRVKDCGPGGTVHTGQETSCRTFAVTEPRSPLLKGP